MASAADVEIKVILSGDATEAAAELLGLDPEDGKRRAIYFWDRPRPDGDAVRLPLLDAGAVIRLRLDEDGDKGDLTAKRRPCDPDTLPEDWRESREGEDWEFTVEEDWAGRDRVWAASLKVDGRYERPAENGSAQPELSRDQRMLLSTAEVAAATLDDLTALGPIRAVRWKAARRDLIHPLVAELWTVGDELRFLELSLRSEPAVASLAQHLLERGLGDLGLRPPARQVLKTRQAMTALARARARV
ncbi:hypothetical protein [Streptomyces sp. SAJ15]|uniref:hypothetical protein n=1 Tax=Streptomyces sp. SAJ15 TaxID=2011095 RepID=UPI001185962E|nr:hypothetical protein [Streptomyces sp. SAJ15]TVL91438.1 hypothetical protein CD790_15895 [Streptomyces sp. SAJ15]